MIAYLVPTPAIELQAVLALDPDHAEAKQLLFPSGNGKVSEQKVCVGNYSPVPSPSSEL
jgi:hypothetical protein